VLRLLPKRLHAGLFQDMCWLRAEKGQAVSMAHVEYGNTDAMLKAWEEILRQQIASGKRNSTISLTVSDSLASIVSLPWQDELRKPAEFSAYARAMFHKAGLTLDPTWAMQSYFRHFRAKGIAYALPIALLEQLENIARKSGCRLDSVLPVSAAAYSLHKRRTRTGITVVLLREASRTSALVYDRNGCIDYSLEPGVLGRPLSTIRLLNRLNSIYAITEVADWAFDFADNADVAGIVAECLPDAEYSRIVSDIWS
jgi:hypothetical protein